MSVVVTAGATAQGVANAFTGGTVTISNLNGGSTFGAGKVVVGFGCNDATDPTSPQIGGVALTKVIEDASSKVQLWYADVSAGTGDSFTFTNGAAFGDIAACCWFLAGAATGNAGSTNTQAFGGNNDPQGVAILVPANGGAVSFLFAYDTPLAATGASWSGATAGPAFGKATNPGAAGAFTTTAGSQTPLASGVTSAFNFIAGVANAAWGAASAPVGTDMISRGLFVMP
jgi:hypothetical protein